MTSKAVDAKTGGLRPFGFKDVFAYGLGDFGCNMSFALKGTLTIFWTQFMGINSYFLATLLLICQIWDAINDPIIGAVIDADTRKYRRNKFLTYVWVGSIGLLVAGALCFVPWTSAPYAVKCILFVAGYCIWDAFYTVANVPYGSLLSLITTDPAERTKLSTGRSIGSMVGSMSTQIIIPFIIYDAANNLRGHLMIVIGLVMGVLGFIAFQYMIRNTVVRVDTTARVSSDAPKFNPLKAAAHFMKNRIAVGATLAPVGMFIGMYGASTASQVMFQAYFKNAQISGLVAMMSYVGLFLFMPFAPKIAARFGKRKPLVIGCLVSCCAYILMLVLPITPDATGLAMYVGCQLLSACGLGFGQCVSWSLMADAMDYEEWKFGTRNEGTTYALHSFFRKLAQGIGPSLGLALATGLGYDATLKANQSPEIATKMLTLVAVMYLVSAAIQFISYAFVYNLDKDDLEKMEADLGKRREDMKVGLSDVMGGED